MLYVECRVRLDILGVDQSEVDVPQQPVARVPDDMEWNWQDFAACHDRDLATFFHPTNARGRSRHQRETLAKAICAGCSVRLECLDYAVRAREPYGVWGGLTETERAAIYESVPSDADRANPGDGVRAAKRYLASVPSVPRGA